MVNTFFIDADPKVTARALDTRRLGKQRVEAYQILKALLGITKGYQNHPATRAWVGHINALGHYYNCMIAEWVRRGRNNTMVPFIVTEPIVYPTWCQAKAVHWSHQARLMQKDTFYTFSPPDEFLKLGYVWPHKYTQSELETLPASSLCEPYVQDVICQGSYARGTPCYNKAKYANLYCGLHRPPGFVEAICQQVQGNGKPCTARARDGGTFCGRHC